MKKCYFLNKIMAITTIALMCGIAQAATRIPNIANKELGSVTRSKQNTSFDRLYHTQVGLENLTTSFGLYTNSAIGVGTYLTELDFTAYTNSNTMDLSFTNGLATTSMLSNYSTTNDITTLEQSILEHRSTWNSTATGVEIPDIPVIYNNELLQIEIPDQYEGAVILDHFDSADHKNEVDDAYGTCSTFVNSDGKFGTSIQGFSSLCKWDYKDTYGPINSTTDFDVSVWIKGITPTTGMWNKGLSMSSGSDIIFDVHHSTNGKMLCYSSLFDSNPKTSPSASSFQADEWSLLTVSYEAASETIRVFVNGNNVLEFSGLTKSFEMAEGDDSNVQVYANPAYGQIKIDEFRFRVGKSRKANFTPPSTPYGMSIPSTRFVSSNKTIAELATTNDLNNLMEYVTTNISASSGVWDSEVDGMIISDISFFRDNEVIIIDVPSTFGDSVLVDWCDGTNINQISSGTTSSATATNITTLSSGSSVLLSEGNEITYATDATWNLDEEDFFSLELWIKSEHAHAFDIALVDSNDTAIVSLDIHGEYDTVDFQRAVVGDLPCIEGTLPTCRINYTTPDWHHWLVSYDGVNGIVNTFSDGSLVSTGIVDVATGFSFDGVGGSVIVTGTNSIIDGIIFTPGNVVTQDFTVATDEYGKDAADSMFKSSGIDINTILTTEDTTVLTDMDIKYIADTAYENSLHWTDADNGVLVRNLPRSSDGRMLRMVSSDDYGNATIASSFDLASKNDVDGVPLYTPHNRESTGSVINDSGFGWGDMRWRVTPDKPITHNDSFVLKFQAGLWDYGNNVSKMNALDVTVGIGGASIKISIDKQTDNTVTCNIYDGGTMEFSNSSTFLDLPIDPVLDTLDVDDRILVWYGEFAVSYNAIRRVVTLYFDGEYIYSAPVTGEWYMAKGYASSFLSLVCSGYCHPAMDNMFLAFGDPIPEEGYVVSTNSVGHDSYNTKFVASELSMDDFLIREDLETYTSDLLDGYPTQEDFVDATAMADGTLRWDESIGGITTLHIPVEKDRTLPQLLVPKIAGGAILGFTYDDETFVDVINTQSPSTTITFYDCPSPKFGANALNTSTIQTYYWNEDWGVIDTNSTIRLDFWYWVLVDGDINIELHSGGTKRLIDSSVNGGGNFYESSASTILTSTTIPVLAPITELSTWHYVSINIDVPNGREYIFLDGERVVAYDINTDKTWNYDGGYNVNDTGYLSIDGEKNKGYIDDVILYINPDVLYTEETCFVPTNDILSSVLSPMIISSGISVNDVVVEEDMYAYSEALVNGYVSTNRPQLYWNPGLDGIPVPEMKLAHTNKILTADIIADRIEPAILVTCSDGTAKNITGDIEIANVIVQDGSSIEDGPYLKTGTTTTYIKYGDAPTLTQDDSFSFSCELGLARNGAMNSASYINIDLVTESDDVLFRIECTKDSSITAPLICTLMDEDTCFVFEDSPTTSIAIDMVGDVELIGWFGTHAVSYDADSGVINYFIDGVLIYDTVVTTTTYNLTHNTTKSAIEVYSEYSPLIACIDNMVLVVGESRESVDYWVEPVSYENVPVGPKLSFYDLDVTTLLSGQEVDESILTAISWNTNYNGMLTPNIPQEFHKEVLRISAPDIFDDAVVLDHFDAPRHYNEVSEMETAISYTPDIVSGVFSNACSDHGTLGDWDYVDEWEIDSSTDFEVSVWLQVDTNSPYTLANKKIQLFRDSDNLDPVFELNTDVDGKLVLTSEYFSDIETGESLSSDGAGLISGTEFTHYAISYQEKDETLRIFVNGVNKLEVVVLRSEWNLSEAAGSHIRVYATPSDGDLIIDEFRFQVGSFHYTNFEVPTIESGRVIPTPKFTSTGIEYKDVMCYDMMSVYALDSNVVHHADLDVYVLETTLASTLADYVTGTELDNKVIGYGDNATEIRTYGDATLASGYVFDNPYLSDESNETYLDLVNTEATLSITNTLAAGTQITEVRIYAIDLSGITSINIKNTSQSTTTDISGLDRTDNELVFNWDSITLGLPSIIEFVGNTTTIRRVSEISFYGDQAIVIGATKNVTASWEAVVDDEGHDGFMAVQNVGNKGTLAFYSGGDNVGEWTSITPDDYSSETDMTAVKTIVDQLFIVGNELKFINASGATGTVSITY